MRKTVLAALLMLGASGIAEPCSAASTVVVVFDRESPRIAFAAGELETALKDRGHIVSRAPLAHGALRGPAPRIVVGSASDPRMVEAMKEHAVAVPKTLKPEGFSLRKCSGEGKATYWVVGADSAGAMYGGLELAEVVRCSELSAVRAVDRNPYMPLRGIKFNCPLDERTPTYHAHTGDSQQRNVLVMWDFDFWSAFIDEMARFRYNYLSLWNLHPFPSMVRVPGYENVALSDVQSVTKTLRMPLDEKIAFWRKVMRYARDRNVDVYVVTWNIFVLGTEGKYGLTDKFDNPLTTDYFRKSVKQMFLTYPDLAGIGLTAGENMPRLSVAQKEKWAMATYGKGILDAAAAQPGRKMTLIHRQHQTGGRETARIFKAVIDHPDIRFLFSFKYAKAHSFSSTRQPYCNSFVKELGDLKTIWTLRNDSNYYFRWGAPDFVREFIRNIPHEVSAGFYYGSDGYVWGREFLSRKPRTPRQLEISKHGYHWMLWGRLGYDPELGDDRIIQMLAAHFPEVPARDLFEAWQRASMVYPVTTGFHWGALDFQWYIEGCCSRPGPAGTKSGFHDVNRFITLGPHPGTDNASIPDFVKAVSTGKPVKGTTPPQVSRKLREHADEALKLLRRMPEVRDEELRRTLGDIRAMSYLGEYYARKIQGATELALYRKIGDKARRASAVKELTEAARFWDLYTAAALEQYINPIRLNRVGVCDWKALSAEVRKDVEIARNARPDSRRSSP